MIVSLVTALPMAFGWTTLGFAMGELFGGIKKKDLLGQDWKPSDLLHIPDEKKRGDAITGIIFYVIFIVFLAFSSEYFGV